MIKMIMMIILTMTKGCQTQPAASHDCSGDDDWRRGWSSAKKAYHYQYYHHY